MNETPTPDLVEIESAARKAAQEAIQTAMRDMPSLDRIISIANQIVEARFAGQGDFNRSYDLHLRTVEDMFRDTAKVANEVKGSLSSLLDLNSKLDHRQTAIENRQDELSKDLQLVMLNQAGLQHDIHGNPDEPHSKSLHQMLVDLNVNFTSRMDATDKKLDEQAVTLKEHGEYITERRKWEALVLKALQKVWDNRISKGAILFTVGSWLGVEAFQWDLVQKIILLAQALFK